jgi:hypothetical protein
MEQHDFLYLAGIGPKFRGAFTRKVRRSSISGCLLTFDSFALGKTWSFGGEPSITAYTLLLAFTKSSSIYSLVLSETL